MVTVTPGGRGLPLAADVPANMACWQVGITGRPRRAAACTHWAGLHRGPGRQCGVGWFTTGQLRDVSQENKNACISAATYVWPAAAIWSTSYVLTDDKCVSTPTMLRTATGCSPMMATAVGIAPRR